MAWATGRILRDRNAGLYLGGVIVSSFGSSAMMLVAGVWTKSLTGSDSLAALMGLCVFAGTPAGPLLGAVADRLPVRRLLVSLNLVIAALMCAALAVDSRERLWLLFAVMTGYGIGFSLLDAGEARALSAGVPHTLLGDLNGVRLSASEGMKLLAPLAGAALYTWAGGRTVVLLDIATFLIAALFFGGMRFPEPPREAPTRGWAGRTAEGAAYLWHNRPLRRLVIAGGLAMVVSGVSGGAVYAIVDNGLGRSPEFAGVLYMVQGLGSVGLGLFAGGLLRRLGTRGFAVAGLAVFAVGVGIRAAGQLPIVLTGQLLVGAGLPAVHIAAMTRLQRETPAGLVGRVAATAGMVMFTPTVLGILGVSGLLLAFDHRVVLIGTAALGALTALYCGWGRDRPDPVTPAGDTGPGTGAEPHADTPGR